MPQLPLGQLLVFGFEGTTLDDDSRRLLSQQQAGGVILFRRNITSLEQVVALNTQVVEACTPAYPPLICVDQEGGRVQRLKDICTAIPAMRVIGELAAQHPKLPYQLGAMMGRELAALGFNLDCAPVLDVDTNPQNPVIGERSFSRDPHTVAELGAAFIKGLQDSGVAACAKHFPGHGDTDTDSHLALPLIHHNRERLDNIELPPFVTAIASQVASIMTAHILVPALDKNRPATLSPIVLTQLLREELGYQGVIVSDDLNMAAVADHYDLKNMLVEGLNAGVDLFLICRDVEKTARALVLLEEAVRIGEVSVATIEAALQRIAHLKKHYIGAMAPPDLAYAKQIVGCSAHQQLAQVWEKTSTSSHRPTSLVDNS